MPVLSINELYSAHAGEASQPLLTGTYYLERALNPFSEVRRGEIGDLLQREVAMLVLARKPNETILIGDDVRIVVVQIQAGRVRLGIEAPPEVRIRRNEILAKTVSQQESAGRTIQFVDAELCTSDV